MSTINSPQAAAPAPKLLDRSDARVKHAEGFGGGFGLRRTHPFGRLGRIDDWPQAKMDEALACGSLMQPREVAACVMFMLTRPRNVTIRDTVILPNSVDL